MTTKLEIDPHMALVVSCAIHRSNNGFLSHNRWAIEPDCNVVLKFANYNLLAKHFSNEVKVDILEEDETLAEAIKRFYKKLSLSMLNNTASSTDRAVYEYLFSENPVPSSSLLTFAKIPDTFIYESAIARLQKSAGVTDKLDVKFPCTCSVIASNLTGSNRWETIGYIGKSVVQWAAPMQVPIGNVTITYASITEGFYTPEGRKVPVWHLHSVLFKTNEYA